jgi:hypothetical protein
MNGIRWKGKDITKEPIIGVLKTRELTLGDRTIPSETFNVTDIVEDGTIYVTDKWYKPGVPQIIHKDLVEEYTPHKFKDRKRVIEMKKFLDK